MERGGEGGEVLGPTSGHICRLSICCVGEFFLDGRLVKHGELLWELLSWETRWQGRE